MIFHLYLLAIKNELVHNWGKVELKQTDDLIYLDCYEEWTGPELGPGRIYNTRAG